MSERASGREGWSLELRVGAFVLGLLALGVLVLLLLGKERQVFEARVPLHSAFAEVQGLAVGAPVRIAGVTVGSVARVGFSEARADRLIHVDFTVRRDALRWVTGDSVARIASQGLLGDKLVEITIGTVGAPPIPPGGEVVGVAPTDVNQLVDRANTLLARAQQVADHVEVATAWLSEPRTVGALRSAIVSFSRLLESAAHGPGLLHALFYDRGAPQHLDAILTALDATSTGLAKGMRRIDRLLDAVNREGAELVHNVSQAARSVGETATDLHDARLIARLDQAAGDLAALTASLRAGRGTVGALLNDPTVYDQLVAVLGGIGRSRVLRALVRFAISSDERQTMGRDLHPVPIAPPLPPAPGAH